MATIESSISLYDNMSPVLNNIMDAMNLTIASVREMQNAMGGTIDTSQFDAAENAIHQAGAAMNELNEQMQRSGENNNINLPPINVPVHWQSDNMEVFTNTGVERFQQEVQSANNMLQTFNNTQEQITATADAMDIFPTDAATDMMNMQNRMNAIQQRIIDISNNRVNMGTDEANAELESMRSQLAAMINEQNRMNAAVSNMDVSGANRAYLNLSSQIRQMEQYIRDHPVNVPVQWQTSNLQVFTNSGIERFRQEVQSANNMLQTLNRTQTQITSAAASMDIFPAEAFADMTNMQNRMNAIQQRIREISNNPVNVGSDRANAELERMRSQLSAMITEQNRMNAAVNNMDVAGANRAYLNLNNQISQMERYLRDNVDEQGRFNQQIREGTTSSNALLDNIKRIAGTYLTLRGAGKVINLSDTMAQTEARMDLIVDDGGSVEELKQKIFNSAQEVRANYQTTASVVAKLGLQAGKAFSGTSEIVAFTELMNKNFKIAGASIQEQTAAMYQLTQAMSAGKLQGDEYRSIIENAPLLANAIEDYMVNVQQAEGTMKEWASEGKLTADVIKNALFSSADEINQRFENIPMTWGEIWTSMQNRATMAFEPVLQKMNDIANSERFDHMVDGAITALTVLAKVATETFDVITMGAEFVYDNWSFVAPVIFGVAGAVGAYTIALVANNVVQGISNGIRTLSAILAVAHGTATAAEMAATTGMTAAQLSFNAALLACPLTWIIVAIIAVVAAIYVGVAAFNKFSDASVSATGIIAGAVAVLAAHIVNTFIVPTWNWFAMLANFFGNVFNDPVAAVKVLFYDMAITVIGYIVNMASAIEAVINRIPGVTVDITSGLDGFYAGLEKAQQKVKDESGWKEYVSTMDYWDYTEAAGTGYEFGSNIDNEVSNFFNMENPLDEQNGFNASDYLSGIENAAANAGDAAGSAADTAANTADIADALDITNEQIKYMRDIKERQIIDRTVYRDINIDMSGTQNIVKNEADLDGICSKMAKKLSEQIKISMEGVG